MSYMKETSAFSILFMLVIGVLNAQDYSKLKDIPLNNKDDCQKAQPAVLQCANELLSSRCSENLESLNSIAFVSRWMEATPDYKFGLNQTVFKAIGSNNLLAGRYLASLAKTALENRIASEDQFQLASISVFLDYCKNPEAAVKVPKKLQRLIDAKQKGTLADAISGS
jgi:hypothetical protein